MRKLHPTLHAETLSKQRMKLIVNLDDLGSMGIMFLTRGGTGKSHLAQAIGHAVIQQGYRVLYRETHMLLEELADAVIDGTRKEFMEAVQNAPLLIIDDFGMPQVAADRGRRSAGNHHAPLRARQHADLESPG